MDTLKCKVVMLPHNQKVIAPTETGRYIMMLHLLGDKYKNLYYERFLDGMEVPNPQHLYFTSNRETQAGDWCIGQSGLYQITKLTEGTTHNGKIEATTDPSPKLPLIPQSFVEKYAQQQGKIEEVLVEVAHMPELTGHPFYLKARPDGTCIIHRVKDSWTREELKEACLDAWWKSTQDRFGEEQSRKHFEDWFDKNY